MNKRLTGGAIAIAALVAAAGLYAVHPAAASDHQDSPVTVSRPGADITDPYIFPSPTNPNDVVVVMNVHPLIPSGQGLSTFFDPQVVYQMNFDTKSENAQTPSPSITRNEVIQFTFGDPGPNQSVTVYGPAAAPTTDSTTTLVAASGSGKINAAFTAGGMNVFAGAREDPFFFDLGQFLKFCRIATPAAPRQSACRSPSAETAPVRKASTIRAATRSKVITSSRSSSNCRARSLEAGNGPKIAYWTTTHTSSGQ